MNKAPISGSNVSSIVKALAFYYNLLVQIDIGFFIADQEVEKPYKKKDIEETLYCARLNRIETGLFLHHILINEAIEEIDFYGAKSHEELNGEYKEGFLYIFYNHVMTLCHAANQILIINYKRRLEVEISEMPTQSKLAKIIKSRQQIENSQNYPKKVVYELLLFLEKRSSDMKELLEIEKSNLNSEVKAILQAHFNKKAHDFERKDLTTPLQNRNFHIYISRLTEFLYVPSYFDITKHEPERYYHIYLLGVLEGRMNDYIVKSNKESGSGRYDIALEPLSNLDPGVIIELKSSKEDLGNEKVKKSLKEAMKQMKSNNYCYEMKKLGVEDILLISIHFHKTNFQYLSEVYKK